ncbi:MAG: PocR ligand-binding domain-containing protein [Bacteroidales bacterium]|nr:PocR ligand-binding domain-containing protein [Bacteroidales bacterium]
MTRNILELIDFEKVDILLEGFNKTTGFVTAILDLDGNVLSQSGWRQICTKFHRVHPETAKRCTESDTVLAGKMAEGEKYHFYQCLNGLVDVAVPLVINGEHIANLFSGQFFFEEPEREFFIKQAQKYNFDNNEYLESLEKVPVISKEKVKTAMDFLLDMTQLITEMTYQKLEQTELNEAVLKSNMLIDNIVNNSSALIYVTDIVGNFQMVNSETEKLFKLPKDKLIGRNRQHLMSKEIAEQHRNNDLTVIQSKKSITIEEENIEPDGTHYYLTQKFPLLNMNSEVYAVGGISSDITELKKAEEEIRKFNEELEKMVAERTAEIVQKNQELEKMNSLFVGREFRIKELKERIKELEEKLKP